MKDLQKALDNVNATYDELVEIAKDIVSRYSSEVDSLIKEVSGSIETLSNDQLRLIVTDLSLKGYSLAEAKEHSLLKSDISETLLDEKKALEFNGADGTVAVRENLAILNSSEEILVNLIYDTVSSLLKAKLDEVHRIVDTIKTVIMSRNTEARINASLNDERVGM